MRHPDHDAIVETIRGWYTRSYPEMGYLVEQRRFGWYSRNTVASSVGRVMMRSIQPDDVGPLLTDAREYYARALVTLYVDDRRLDEKLGPALVAAACGSEHGETYLAHVGPLPDAPAPPGLDVCDVTLELLEEYVVTKRKGFADSEVEPAPEEVAEELALRRAELAGQGRFAVARLIGEPVAVAGWYAGEDVHIFQLATRLPFRRRGIATALLRYVLDDSYRHGSRSVVINADEEGRPMQLYRRLGFTDEVYWRRPYRVPPLGA